MTPGGSTSGNTAFLGTGGCTGTSGGREAAPAHAPDGPPLAAPPPPPPPPARSLPCRQGFKYEGVYRRKGGLPLLLAAVEGTDHEGRLFRWVARRARKRVLQPYRCSKPLPPVDWLGWLDARQHWRKLGWWIAILYSLGSLLFVISGVAGEIQSVSCQQRLANKVEQPALRAQHAVRCTCTAAAPPRPAASSLPARLPARLPACLPFACTPEAEVLRRALGCFQLPAPPLPCLPGRWWRAATASARCQPPSSPGQTSSRQTCASSRLAPSR